MEALFFSRETWSCNHPFARRLWASMMLSLMATGLSPTDAHAQRPGLRPVQQRSAQQPVQRRPVASAPQTPPQQPPGARSVPRDPSRGEGYVQSAREKAETAQTLAEYNEVIQLCLQARQQSISQNSAAYVDQLLGWAYNRRGEVYLEKSAALSEEGKKADAKKYDTQALAEFERSVKYDPNRWKAYLNRGVSYASVGKGELAITDFSRVIKLNPEYTNAYFNRAEIRYDRREYEHAIADYTEVIRMKPSDVAAITGRGHAYFQVAKFREALTDYDRTVELSTDDPYALTNRADAEARLGQWEKAANDYRQAVELEPNLARAYQGAAWLMATCPDEKIRNQKLALQAAKKAIELNGEDNAKFLDTLAAAYANAGQFEEAKALVTRAVSIAPAADAEPFKVRLASYEQGEPYRVGRVTSSPTTDKRKNSGR